MVESRNRVIKVGLTETEQEFVSVRFKDQDLSLTQYLQHHFVLNFPDIHQLH